MPAARGATDPADVRQLFPGLADTIYLNTATMNVGSAPAKAAYDLAVQRWSAGRFDWMEAERAGEAARAMFAEIIGATAGEIAIVPAVSTGAGIVAANLPHAQHGENIVVAENEFTSNYFPWLLLRERGYEVRTVAPDGDGVSATAFGHAADGGTRLIAVSAVHSATGYRADLPALSRIAGRSGAWFFVDACQAAGAVPLDVVRDGVDFLAAASHKFLLGSRGMGYLYVRRGLLDSLRPIVPGWKAARNPAESFYGPRMDLSPTASKLDASLAWFPALAEEAGLGIFGRFGTAALLDRNARLARHLEDALAAQGSAYRPFPEQHRSTIVSVPVHDEEAILARFRQANVVASVRGGRIRLAVHFYNLEEELDRVTELIGHR
ncbi:aminotransferase class V-fold PLP-dependent enzyme [Arthrobacter oryzae]|uniref:Selenocysteine lyase/cysteine desulfurase n=1 Tax=Arthrobacter oryzae TaxID=409290 RepID=A0A495FKY8_9MICC|nr:aminotransferase class V-fold PLP-dependent enzyme [Arthrobacter oryzae]RKR29910.1 selenocysteine lyase/cysteine desulfurase [Arthrobacter oryzae]